MNDTNSSGPRRWQLRVFGTFELFDPDGTSLRLGNRKVEALLAVLALHPRLGLSRSEVGEIIWPGKPPELQAANLRQALSLLRKAIGENGIESSRSHCRISSTLDLDCDYHLKHLRSAGGFMPGHDGEWFDSIRASEQPDTASVAEAPLVIESFTRTLRWFAENDPAALSAIVRASGSLVRGVPPNEMLSILSSAGKDALGHGWFAYWKGAFEEDLLDCARWLEFALAEACRQDDHALASEVSLELGKVYSRTGQLDGAKRMLNLAQVISRKSNDRKARINAARLRGSLLVHWGDVQRGLAAYEIAQNLTENPIDRGVLQAVRAFFEAIMGFDERANDMLSEPKALLSETGHRGLAMNCAMAELVLHAKGAGYRDAVPELEQLSAQAYKFGITQYGVYADEALARAYGLAREKEPAVGRAKAAARGRRAAKMVRTPIEERMIQAIGG